MTGFLKSDDLGPALADQSWNVIADAATVLNRMDRQLQKKFEEIDQALEEQRTRSLSVAELVEKWNAFSAERSVESPEKISQVEQRCQVGIEMNMQLSQQMRENLSLSLKKIILY